MSLTQRRRFALIGVFFYVFFLLGWMPAEVVARLVSERSHHSVFLLDPKGTAWDGNASSLVITSAADQISLPNIRWHARLDRLVRGQLAAELRVGSDSHGVVATTPNSLTLENASITLPANLLTIAAPALAVWRPAGDIKLDTARLTISSDGADGQATLLWQHAGTSLSRVQPLGDYSASIDGKKTALQFVITTLSGPLQISGQGSWRNKADWEFNGQARATQGKQAELDDLLKLFSRQRTGDNYLLQFSSAATK